MKMKNGNKVILKVKILRKIKQLQKKQTKESEKKRRKESRQECGYSVLGSRDISSGAAESARCDRG